MSLMRTLRDAPFLHAARLRAYLRLLAVFVVLGQGGALVQTAWRIWHDPQHLAPVSDFSIFKVAGGLALQGQGAAIYNPGRTDPEVGKLVPLGPHDTLPFFYPPVFILFCLPLALVPYLVAYYGFLLTGYGACCALLLRQNAKRLAPLAILVMPAALINSLNGQNGFLSGIAFAGGAVWLEEKPVLAGIFLGLLAFKPQLALALPIGLFAARRFKAAFATAMTAATLSLASLALFGMPTWRAFFAASAGMRQALMLDRSDWIRQLSLYTALRMTGLAVSPALAAQGILAIAILALTYTACRKRPGAGAEIAVMAAAATLVSPHIMDYDLPILAPGLMWAAASGFAGGFAGFEKSALMLAYLLPLYARLMNVGPGIPVAFLVLLTVFGFFWRRAMSGAPRAVIT
jgi:hypothetical protein